jgi:glycosyltransferase involved in cell wall biosynthesis
VDAVVTVSEHAANDLRHYLGVPSFRLFVVPNGVSPAFHPRPSASVQRVTARYDLDGPYVLSVAAHQARKNVGRVVEAFAQIRACQPDLLLALAGPTLWGFPEHRERIARLGLTKAVRVLGYVPDDDLPALYSGASAFAFPSLYEGFGLPVLEAMACGTPVVCSNASSLPEVAGDAAITVDPTDVSGLASALVSVVGDTVLAGRLRERGLARATAFTWQQAAQTLSNVYEEVIDR